MKPLRTLGRGQPEESWGGWQNFLNSCKLKKTIKGVKHYYSSNCNYIVFPNNVIIENFGYHGDNTMARVKEYGWREYMILIIKNRRKWFKELRAVGYPWFTNLT